MADSKQLLRTLETGEKMFVKVSTSTNTDSISVVTLDFEVVKPDDPTEVAAPYATWSNEAKQVLREIDKAFGDKNFAGKDNFQTLNSQMEYFKRGQGNSTTLTLEAQDVLTQQQFRFNQIRYSNPRPMAGLEEEPPSFGNRVKPNQPTPPAIDEKALRQAFEEILVERYPGDNAKAIEVSVKLMDAFKKERDKGKPTPPPPPPK